MGRGKRLIFVVKGLAAESIAPIGVRWAAVGIVPGRVAAVADFGRRLVPGPAFHERLHPQIQVERGDVRPDVADLLLSSAPDFLHVVKVLLDRRSIGEGFDDFPRRRVGMGAEEELAAAGLLDKDHANEPARRSPGTS